MQEVSVNEILSCDPSVDMGSGISRVVGMSNLPFKDRARLCMPCGFLSNSLVYGSPLGEDNGLAHTVQHLTTVHLQPNRLKVCI